MKFSVKHFGVLILAVVLSVLLFTPLASHLRRYIGVIRSEIKIALRNDKKISSKSYDWLLMDSNGKAYSFNNERGKVVFLNFWATWCAPCIKEMPDIQKLYDDYGEKVRFLLVTDEDSAKVDTFLRNKKYNLPIYYSKGNIPAELASKTLPTTYILDKSGKIVLAKTGITDWNGQEIRSLLDGLLGE